MHGVYEFGDRQQYTKTRHTRQTLRTLVWLDYICTAMSVASAGRPFSIWHVYSSAFGFDGDLVGI